MTDSASGDESPEERFQQPTNVGDDTVNAEQKRLEEARDKKAPWKRWGPYLSERQWGTVREDYSESGDAWNYFSHDQARSRAYRWGEDGLAGISTTVSTCVSRWLYGTTKTRS